MTVTEEEVAYRMPKVGVGMPVKIFPNGKPDETPAMAFVVKCGDRSVAAKNMLGQAFGAARHVTDPVLLSRDDAFRKDCGAWDFTDDAKRMVALEERVALLEELFDKKPKAK